MSDLIDFHQQQQQGSYGDLLSGHDQQQSQSTGPQQFSSKRAPPAYRSRVSDWGMPDLNTRGGNGSNSMGVVSPLSAGGAAASMMNDSLSPASYQPRAPPKKPTRKYNKLELLQLYQPTMSPLPKGLLEDDFVISNECKEPLNKTYSRFEKDARINPDFVYARGRGIPAGTGSATTSTRGRGRGVGGGRGRGLGGRGTPLSQQEGAVAGMPSWAMDPVARDEKPMFLRGFTDEERENIMSDSSKGASTTDIDDQGTFDELGEEITNIESSNATGFVDFDSMWLYKDKSSGAIHGPFALRKLNDWVEASFFDPDLEVQQEGAQSFLILRDVIHAANRALPHPRLAAVDPALNTVQSVVGALIDDSPARLPASVARQTSSSAQQQSQAQKSLQFADVAPTGALSPQQPHPTQQAIPAEYQAHMHAAQQQYYAQQQYPAAMMPPWQASMMTQPLSADRLESFFLQNNVPMQYWNQMSLMNQMQQQQQYMWSQMQQQQLLQQQQQHLAQAQQQQQQDVAQHVQPQQQQQVQQKHPASVVAATVLETGNDDESEDIESPTSPVEETTFTTVQTQKTSSSNKKNDAQSKKSEKQAPAQKSQPTPVAASKPTPPPPVQPVVKPHAVPAKPDPVKTVEQPQVKPAPIVVQAGLESDVESQYLYDRQSSAKNIGTLSSLLPQQVASVPSAPVSSAPAWGMSTDTSVVQPIATGKSILEIQQQQNKERKKQVKKERQQILAELEQKQQPVWGASAAAPQQSHTPSLLEIQQQEAKSHQKSKQAEGSTKVSHQRASTSYSSKVGATKPVMLNLATPVSQPTVWGSGSGSAKSLKEIQEEEKRGLAANKQQQQQQQQGSSMRQAASLAEQLARQSSNKGKGQTGMSKAAAPSIAAVAAGAQGVGIAASQTAKLKPMAQHFNYPEEEIIEQQHHDEEEMLWDYGDKPAVSTGAFSSTKPSVPVVETVPAPSKSTGKASSGQQKKGGASAGSFAALASGHAHASASELGSDAFPVLQPTSGKGKKKGGSNSDANAFGVKEVSSDLQKWFQTQVQALGQKYEPTLLYFLMSVETDDEVDGYISEYFGSSQGAKKFSDQFKAYKKHVEKGGTGAFNPNAAASKQSKDQEEFREAKRKGRQQNKKQTIAL